MPQADNILKRDTVKQQGGYGVQAVKPAAGLVNGFTDVVGREPAVLTYSFTLRVKGVVPLG